MSSSSTEALPSRALTISRLPLSGRDSQPAPILDTPHATGVPMHRRLSPPGPSLLGLLRCSSRAETASRSARHSPRLWVKVFISVVVRGVGSAPNEEHLMALGWYAVAPLDSPDARRTDG